MSLYDEIIKHYPELKDSNEFNRGKISLRNDGNGDYIEKWEYEKPIPNGFTIGKLGGN